jgi:amino acid transporter/mannitol/fructose-specific phosphotransferase system IIA component (Ntr-type)
MSEAKPAGRRLKKELGLWDVYAVSTGAMFSSGFFLLPGIATAYAGPSTVLAYLLAGILMIPAMFSIAELATALPRAGGTYYFLDRSLGPAAGTVGGLGTWLALVLKSAFALLGMGAYLAITPYVRDWMPGDGQQQEWVIKGLAVALTVVFAAVNIFGAKETTRLQGILVISLLAVLAFFLVQGVFYVFFRLPPEAVAEQFTPFFLPDAGLDGILATIGLVFVSYAGLTKVAAISEEVKRPDRNLPLGMFLSLGTATLVYVVGVAIMIAVLDPGELREDYTPVASAAGEFFAWLPEPTGLILIILAALAAFASTGNAGILAASRYPLAMARDRLIGERFGELGRFGTPTLGILTTAGLMIFFIVALSAEGVAKVASAFNLFVFGMMNVAVVVMRESRIESYDPGFRSPWYPWMQVAGLIIAVWLIGEMGALAITASLGLALLGVLWFLYYARPRVVRDGAIYHIFARLGRRQFDELDLEFRQILKEKGLREDDPFDDVVTRAGVFDAPAGTTFVDLIEEATAHFASCTSLSEAEIRRELLESGQHGNAPIAHEAILPHFRSDAVSSPEMFVVRCVDGVAVELPEAEPRLEAPPPPDAEPRPEVDRLTRREDEREAQQAERPESVGVKAAFFLLSPEQEPGLHLRILAQLAGRLEASDFRAQWGRASNEQTIKEALLRDERFLSFVIDDQPTGEAWAGRTLSEVEIPAGTLVAMVRRGQGTFVPGLRTKLQAGDRLTVVGQAEGIRRLRESLGMSVPPTPDESTD